MTSDKQDFPPNVHAYSNKDYYYYEGGEREKNNVLYV